MTRNQKGFTPTVEVAQLILSMSADVLFQKLCEFAKGNQIDLEELKRKKLHVLGDTYRKAELLAMPLGYEAISMPTLLHAEVRLALGLRLPPAFVFTRDKTGVHRRVVQP